MGIILLVSSIDKSIKILTNLIEECGNFEVKIAVSCEECRQIIIKETIDLIVINSPLYDEVGNKLSIYLNESTYSSIIFICKGSMNKNITRKMEEKGIIIIEKPFNSLTLKNAIILSMINRKKTLGIIDENIKLKEKLKDLKIIYKAKCILIESLKMREEEAHNYIEKQAMDMRMKKIDVAKKILKMYKS